MYLFEVIFACRCGLFVSLCGLCSHFASLFGRFTSLCSLIDFTTKKVTPNRGSGGPEHPVGLVGPYSNPWGHPFRFMNIHSKFHGNLASRFWEFLLWTKLLDEMTKEWTDLMIDRPSDKNSNFS